MKNEESTNTKSSSDLSIEHKQDSSNSCLDLDQNLTQESSLNNQVCSLKVFQGVDRNIRVNNAKAEMLSTLDSMENLVWWLSNEKQKEAWSGLISKLRNAAKEMENEHAAVSQESDLHRTELLNTLAGINNFKIKLMGHANSSNRFSAPWIADELRDSCRKCNSRFNFFFRGKHHCRLCGDIFCNSCTRNRVPVPRWGYMTPVRVCDQCSVQSNAGLLMDYGSMQSDVFGANLIHDKTLSNSELKDRLDSSTQYRIA